MIYAKIENSGGKLFKGWSFKFTIIGKCKDVKINFLDRIKKYDNDFCAPDELKFIYDELQDEINSNEFSDSETRDFNFLFEEGYDSDFVFIGLSMLGFTPVSETFFYKP